MFKMLYEAEIPVLIFSAGLGNIIEEILEKFGVFYSNLEIISNYIQFNEDGSLRGYKDLLVHPLNKNESILPNENKYFMDLSHRDNAILLGDHLADIHMSRGMPHVGSVLKIGFLNEKVGINKITISIKNSSYNSLNIKK
jgi:5'-nucleotidase